MPPNRRTRKADRDPPYGKSNRRRRMRIGQETNTGTEQAPCPATSGALRSGQGCLRAESLLKLAARNPFEASGMEFDPEWSAIANNPIHLGIAYLLAIPIV